MLRPQRFPATTMLTPCEGQPIFGVCLLAVNTRMIRHPHTSYQQITGDHCGLKHLKAFAQGHVDFLEPSWARLGDVEAAGEPKPRRDLTRVAN